MAFQLNAILRFSSTGAERSLQRTKAKFNSFRSSVRKASEAVSRVGQGLRSAGIGLAPLTIGAAAAIKTFASFEAQMATVQAILLSTDEDMKELNSTTKLLGATTIFTAKQAGEGAEFLARAGLNQRQVIAALPGVLDAAAASGITLADSARITVNQLGAFGLEAKEAVRVADVLALATARTNTNMIELGDALKLAGPAAKQLGIPFEETAAALGIISNAGIKGTLAGTAFKNALVRLTKPSKLALKALGGKEGLARAMKEVVDGQIKLRPVPVIMANISKKIAAIRDPAEKARIAFEVFGLRGAGAFSAFDAQFSRSVKITNKNSGFLIAGFKKLGKSQEEINKILSEGTIPFITALRVQLLGAAGSATLMAKIRLRSLIGQFTLLKSATEGLGIEIGAILALGIEPLVKKSVQFIQVLVRGFQLAGGETINLNKEMKNLKDNQFAGLLISSILFAEGFKEGFKEIKTTAKDTFKTISNFLKPIIDLTGLSAKDFGKIAAKILIIGAVAAPILGFLGIAFFVIGGAISGIIGLFSLMGSVLLGIFAVMKFVLVAAFGLFSFLLSPIGLIIAGIAGIGAVLFIFRKEIKDTAISAFNSVKDFFAQPLISILFKIRSSIIQALLFPFKAVISTLKILFAGLVGFLPTSFLDKLGLTTSGIKSALSALPGIAGIDALAGIGVSVTPRINNSDLNADLNFKRITTETLKQKASVKTPSEDALLSEIRQLSANQGRQGQASQQTNVNLQGEFRLRNKDLVLAVTKGMIENSEANGRTVLNKTELLTNGLGIGK